MPEYSVSELLALRASSLVSAPPFEWNEIEKAPARPAHSGGSWRRGSHGAGKRPVVMPKAAIPFSQRALLDQKDGSSASNSSSAAAVNEEDDGSGAEDDEYAARVLLKSRKPASQKPAVAEDGAPVVNLSYASALAATMKMAAEDTQATTDEASLEGDDWVSVGQKPRRQRKSFSKWR